jgi:hypothetical protein
LRALPSLPRRRLTTIASTAVLGALLTASLGALAGCGRTDEQKVKDTVNSYIKARASNDYTKICDLFDDSFRRDQGLLVNCAEKLAAQDAGQPPEGSTSIVSIKVKGDTAGVSLNSSQGGQSPSRLTLSLVQRDGHWKVSGTT